MVGGSKNLRGGGWWTGLSKPRTRLWISGGPARVPAPRPRRNSRPAAAAPGSGRLLRGPAFTTDKGAL